MGEFNYVGLGTLLAKARGATVVAVDECANHLVAEAADAAPVDTGTLRASIHTDGAKAAGNTVTAKVATGGEANDYAVYVHEGTGPHEIVAQPGGVLHFGDVFVHSVHHPGTHATKFLEGPLLANRAVYLEIMRRAFRGAF
jgi:hypothetical protein